MTRSQGNQTGEPEQLNDAYRGIIVSMAVIHISEADAVRDFASLLARVRAGAEVIIEDGARAVVVMRPASDEFRPRCSPNPSL